MKFTLLRLLFLPLILISSSLSSAADFDCSLALTPVSSLSTELIVSPSVRAASEVQKGRQLLAQGRRGADAFLQVALVHTNRELIEIGRAMTIENFTPLKTGAEINAETRAAEISGRLDRIMTLAAQANTPQGFFSKNVLRKESPAMTLETEVNTFFDKDISDAMEFETRRKTVSDELENEERRINQLLSRLRREQSYVSALISGIHADTGENSTERKVDIETDFQLSEKLRYIAEHEVTLSQALLKVQMRMQQLSLISLNMSAVRARVPIAGAHVASFLDRLKKYEEQQAILEKERQRATALPGNQARMREKNVQRHARVDEIRSQHRVKIAKIDEFWFASISRAGFVFTKNGVASGVVESVEPAFDRAVLRARTEAHSVPIHQLFLADVPKDFFGMVTGDYIRDSLSERTGRIIGISPRGNLLAAGLFESFVVDKRHAAPPSSLELQILKKYDLIRAAIQEQWLSPSLKSQKVFARLEDGSFVDGDVLSVDEGRLLLAISGQTRFFDSDHVALRQIRSTSEWKPQFPVGSTVSDGQRLGTVIGFFMNGQALFETAPSRDNGKVERFVKAEEYLMTARFPKPLYKIGSKLTAVETYKSVKLQTTYTVLGFDPATKSYLVRPENEYLRGKFSDVSNYGGWELDYALEEKIFSDIWLTAEQLTQTYFRIKIDRRWQERGW